MLERPGRVLSGPARSWTPKARSGWRSQRGAASLGATFGQNVLADEKRWALFLDEGDLAGLPEFLKAPWRRRPKARGEKGRYAVTLSRSIYEPFTTFSDRRDLREIAFRAFTNRGEIGGKTDNGEVVAKTLRLRAEKARLLGYDSYAALKLDDTMAKTPSAVFGLLDPVWEQARRRRPTTRRRCSAWPRPPAQRKDRRLGLALLSGEAPRRQIRLRRGRAEALSPARAHHRRLLRRRDAAVRRHLRGEARRRRPGIPTCASSRCSSQWHASWDIPGRLFRASLEAFGRLDERAPFGLPAGQGLEAGDLQRHEFRQAAAGEPALLSLDEARTLFHEFGHALHGILTDVNWPSVSGTSVCRDFVELPSQLYEHWLTVPAEPRKTCAPLQDRQADAEGTARQDARRAKLRVGFATVEFTSSALVDMAYHAQAGRAGRSAAFRGRNVEKARHARRHRHASSHAALPHVFSGEGYSAGYYSYMWSEVLDADAFAAFEEAGDPFDPELAARLKQNFMQPAAGGSGGALHRLSRQDADPGRDDGQARAGVAVERSKRSLPADVAGCWIAGTVFTFPRRSSADVY